MAVCDWDFGCGRALKMPKNLRIQARETLVSIAGSAYYTSFIAALNVLYYVELSIYRLVDKSSPYA